MVARAGGIKVEIPDPADARRQFDTWLMQDDMGIDPLAMIKMRALGVSKGR